MLGQRRRRWTNIDPTMAQCLVFAGWSAEEPCQHLGMLPLTPRHCHPCTQQLQIFARPPPLSVSMALPRSPYLEDTNKVMSYAKIEFIVHQAAGPIYHDNLTTQ